jgi:NADPH:quinone reductase
MICMSTKLPATMRAVQLDAVGQPLTVRKVSLPEPQKGEVLVNITASPVNPSDLAFMMGAYDGFKGGLPVTPGNECSGIVVSSGPGLMGRRLVGKRVACFAREGLGGAWAEYMVTKVAFCVPIGNKIDLENASMALINPLTAYAFMDIVKRGKHRAFANTAAASALGQMLIRMSISQDIALVNIVRSESQVGRLKGLGAEYIINSNDSDFEVKLKDITHQLNVKLFLDAVGGTLLGKLLKVSPKGSTILSYGRLSDETCVIEPGALILQRKNINGFLLSDWVKKRNILQVLNDLRKLKSMLSTHLHTDIKVRVALESINEALQNYKNEMSGGKTILLPELKNQD